MATEKENNNYVMCLNDMGGGVMNVSVKVCNTLRAQSHNHEPVVVFNEDDNADKFKAVTEVGGGSESVSGNRLQRATSCDVCSENQTRVIFSDYNDKVGSLMASDSKHIGNEYVNQGKVVVGWTVE